MKKMVGPYMAIFMCVIMLLAGCAQQTDLVNDGSMGIKAVTSAPVFCESIYDAGLLDNMNAVQLEEWVPAGFDIIQDDMQAIVRSVQQAQSYESSLRVGFDINGDVSQVGEDLLVYVGMDMTADSVSNLITDLRQSNGVFYDTDFSRAVSTSGDVSWEQRDNCTRFLDGGYRNGFETVYANGYQYSTYTGPQTNPDVTYFYVGNQVDAAAAASMDDYQFDLLFDLLQPVLVSCSVDAEDVAAYRCDKTWGTSYFYKMTEQLFGQYAVLTKTVLMDCLDDGAYEITVVYALEGTDVDGILVINAETDTVNVVVESPDVNDVYFLSEK